MLENFKRTATFMRIRAQKDFDDGVDALIAEIRRAANAASGALGEISVAEAWAVIRRVASEELAKHEC